MSQIGIVFDIQRCSLRDGPGIRTTVFLKGCPLACVWCHNPESISPRPELGFRAEACVHCLACVERCPHGAHRAEENRHVLDRTRCIACGACAPACPQSALRLIGETMTVEQVLAEVEADGDYYAQSGGGMTLSGGEPMMQFAFIRELLALAKDRGIHTCLETCGLAGREKFRQILPLVDLFLFDYKATDPQRHRAFTGVTNRRILSNLEFLCRHGAQILLRCPLVPGVNDDPGHLRGIADLSRRYPEIRGIELLAYHEMGKDKARQVDRPATLDGVKTTEETTKAAWIETLARLGCENVKIG